MKWACGVAFKAGGWALGAAIAASCASCACAAQQPLDPVLSANQTSSKKKPPKHKQPVPEGPAPNMRIPVTPLGFAPPAVFYLTERFSQVSLSFLSENTLLFTFRVPGLIPRTTPSDGEMRPEPRQIRALVLELPTGRVAAEALWEVHDYAPYLIDLKDGKFLLRDRNLVQMGDASLHLDPFLRFPGNVTYLELDPEKRYLVAHTTEQPAVAKTEHPPLTAPSVSPASASVVAAGHGTAQPDAGQQGPAQDSSAEASRQPDQSLLRILSMQSRSVMLFSRVTGIAHLPIDGEGYYEALRGAGPYWVINYQDFHGASRPVGAVKSACYPSLDVLAPGAVLASACGFSGGRTLSLMQRGAASQNASSLAPEVFSEKQMHNLWDVPVVETHVWPQIVVAPEGRRFARSTLDVTHPVGPSSPINREDIRSQTVEVYDAATGKVALSVQASPILDGGGNFALSASGARFAVLREGALEIYDLPPAPPLPELPAARP